jgi:hypothetical protein
LATLLAAGKKPLRKFTPLFIEDLRVKKQELHFFGCMHCTFLASVEWFLLSDPIQTYAENSKTSPLNCSARNQFNILINVPMKQF